jgi:membrane-bound lytic murein transglycosylase D
MDPEFLKKVEMWIERFTKNDAHLRVLERKTRYWPVIERAFLAEGLPTDLGYVAWVESGFEPEARSGMGAFGMWQFMLPSGKAFNLVITPQVDERLNVEKSSVAAARYFTLLLKMFGSERYLLALASYNAGQNKIKRKAIAAVIRKAKLPDFWHLWGDLPPETVDYVPKVLAAIIVSRNPERW